MSDKSLHIDKLNIPWKPAITSTPLKSKSARGENKNVKNSGCSNSENLLSSVLSHYQRVNNDIKSRKTIKKNFRKSKQSFHFDESSSSADEDITSSSSKNLDVKINLSDHSRIKEKEIDIKFEEAINFSHKNVKTKKTTPSNLKKNNKKNNELTLKQKIAVPLVVNENSILFKKSEKKKKVLKNKIKYKNSIVNNSKENIITFSNEKESDKNEISQVVTNKENQFLKNEKNLETIDDNNKLGENCVSFKIPLKFSSKTKKIDSDVPVKRKDTACLNSNIPRKKMKKKKLQENIQNSITNYLKSPSLDCEKKNLSHQLFSESKEQELIDSLNMTVQEKSPLKQKNILANNVEINEKLETNNETCLNKNLEVLKIRKTLVDDNKNVECNSKCKVPVPIIKDCEEQLLNKNATHFETSHSSALQSKEIILNNEKNDDESKNSKQKVRISGKIKRSAKNEKSNLKNEGELSELDENRKKTEENCKSFNNLTVGKNAKLSIHDIFKITNQLTSFTESQPGCFTEECWSLKNFKCGILKLKPKSKIGSKTVYENSYFGGVILKGSVKIHIGNHELEVQEGGMAFVPPLTEWMIINIKKTEAVMYYWFGRFKA